MCIVYIRYHRHIKMRITIRESAERRRITWNYSNVRLTGTTLTYPNTLFFTNNQLVLPIVETTMSLAIGSQYELMGMEFEPPSDNPTKSCTSPLFFFIYNTDNYFHYLYDAIPILYEFFQLRETIPDLKLLMNPARNYPYILDCLLLLGIDESNIVYANRETLYTSIHVASSPTHEGVPNTPPRADVWEIYLRMKKTAFEHPIETPKKFYISRRSWIHGDTSNMGTNYTTRRKLMNEDELVSILEKHGYEEVFCEKLSMLEKIQYFANATHIVGAIGGGMCNLVFASPNCKVVSINSPEFDTINRRFLYTMLHTNLYQFKDTHAVSNLYRRVKIGNKIGEVFEQSGHILRVHINPSGVTFQNDDIFDVIEISETDVEYLDKGLNSPWNFQISNLAKYI